MGRLQSCRKKAAYKAGFSPQQDTAALAVICRRQQQAAVVDKKPITRTNDTLLPLDVSNHLFALVLSAFSMFATQGWLQPVSPIGPVPHLSFERLPARAIHFVGFFVFVNGLGAIRTKSTCFLCPKDNSKGPLVALRNFSLCARTMYVPARRAKNE